ncbi:MAG TPA: class I SAM-dependent methyltransferase, partial [Burkholderiales bacterium]|nr:class I SAM-dependent methyltransferase [Burkholderiales bacterium]
MNLPRDPPVARDEFDAALIPGFREAVRGDYVALEQAWQHTWSDALDAEGRLAQGAAVERDCPLCAAPGSASRLHFVKLGMRIVSCLGCAFTYSRDVLKPELDRALYQRSSAQSSYRDLKRNAAYRELEEKKCRYILQQALRYLGAPGSLLDIGIGAGRLIAAALAAGWKPLGVEADPVFAAEARAAGLTVIDGFFPPALGGPSRYDLVTMLDVIEHSVDPVLLLREARARLAPGGVLAIQVPNFDSLVVRLEGPANSNFCHGHWNYFVAGSLERTARLAGLEMLDVRTIISELDRLAPFAVEEVARLSVELTGAVPPAGGPTADWLHANHLGYKLLGYFRARR